jgi:hypothetical protein
MRTSFFALILVIIGIITALISIALAFQGLNGSETTSSYSGSTTVITHTSNAHAGLGSIACGIISAACFLGASIRLSNQRYD